MYTKAEKQFFEENIFIRTPKNDFLRLVDVYECREMIF